MGASSSGRVLTAAVHVEDGFLGGSTSGMIGTWWVELHFGAVCQGTVPLGTIRATFLVSTPLPTDALLCRFSAVVSLQVMRWLSGPVEKLPLRTAEGMTKSGECVRALAVRAGVCGAFKRAFSHLGC